MDGITEVRALVRSGQFRVALRHLADLPQSSQDTANVASLRAELFERVGRHGQARALAERLLRTKGLGLANQATCEYVLGRLDCAAGEPNSGATHFHRAVELATAGADLERSCWARLRLLVIIADQCGAAGAGPFLAEARNAVARFGDAVLSAALHIFVAEIAAKRGSFLTATRHTQCGLSLLERHPNVWLSAMAENNACAIALLSSDLDRALDHGVLALQLAQTSGSAGLERACRINLSNLWLSLGDFARALEHAEQAARVMPLDGEHYEADVDNMARICLAEGQLDECDRLIEEFDNERTSTVRVGYVHRHSLLTRTKLLLRRRRWTEGFSQMSLVTKAALVSGDESLVRMAKLTNIEALYEFGAGEEATGLLFGVSDSIEAAPLDLYAHYERILACALARSGSIDAGRAHMERARRVYTGLRTKPGLIELARRWEDATAAALPSRPTDPNVQAARNMLHGLAGLLLATGRPELVAREMLQLLADTRVATYAAIVVTTGDAEPAILETFGDRSSDTPEHRLAIGNAGDRQFELVIAPNEDVEAPATVNALGVILGAVREIERARAEHEEHTALWPADDDLDAGESVASGQLRGLFQFARRVATTNVAVLISGESGTGKEVLARAIHRHSPRAAKPFVPFNCAAVPRDLLESQLFGHRRGAFTGADRDHLGVIRATGGGTLFLDEIGDLDLDLQPKLLRFLESGEILPIGEPAPLRVDVRIVAATNRDLEQEVREGRFREDLFYRLDVVRLRIPPLRERRDEIPALVRHFTARAADEFHKGAIRVADATLEHLLLFHWPGNVRHLQNEVRRLVLLAEPNAVLQPTDLHPDIVRADLRTSSDDSVAPTGRLAPELERIERRMIKAALRAHGGKVEPAARALGISRKGLYLKRQRLGI